MSMKKRIFKATLASIILAFFAFTTLTQADPAIVTLQGTCFMLDANGDTYLAENVHITQSSDNSGNVTVHCHGKLPDGAALPESKAVLLDNESTDKLCSLGDGTFSPDWHNVVTKSGRTNLSCHLNPGS